MHESNKTTTYAASSKLTKRMKTKWGSRQSKQLAVLLKENTTNPDLPHFNNNKRREQICP